MKNILLATMVSFLISSCGEVYVKGEGEVVTQQQQVSDFSSIEISAPANVAIQIQEGNPSVSLSAQKNILEQLKVNVKEKQLTIDVIDGVSLESETPVVINITVAQLQEIELHGAVTAAVKGEMKSDKINCDLSGSTNLTIASLQAASFDLDISGAGKVEVASGNTQTASYSVSGSGKIYTYNLQAENVDVDVSGAGLVQTSVSKNLEVSISGAGNVSYKGNPAIKKEISGAGSLNAAQ